MDVEPQRAVGQVIDAINRDVLPELAGNYPGLTWSFEGSDAEMREAMSSLGLGLGLALVVIYALLAVAFRHYVQPLIVLAIIPFGIVGAVIGHMLLGYDLSLISFMGVIALSGVVVNDSLIMIDYANRHRDTKSAFDAIFDAGVRRFPSDLPHDGNDVLGLCPIILEQSLQAQYIIPMAISLGFGIVFATTGEPIHSLRSSTACSSTTLDPICGMRAAPRDCTRSQSTLFLCSKGLAILGSRRPRSERTGLTSQMLVWVSGMSKRRSMLEEVPPPG
jgi:hypothetical protein